MALRATKGDENRLPQVYSAFRRDLKFMHDSTPVYPD